MRRLKGKTAYGADNPRPKKEAPAEKRNVSRKKKQRLRINRRRPERGLFMKETKEQIAKRLKTYYADELEDLYDLTAHMLLGNTDFEAAATADDEDVIPLIENMTGKKVSFGYEDIISGEDLELYKKITAYTQERILKAKMIDTLSSVFASDTLFEGLCLASGVPDENLGALCGEIGCPERFAELFSDPVFQRRKSYIKLIGSHARAAVNLYGCIHVGEFSRLVRKYEKHFRKAESCIRQEGSYRYTLVFSPEFFCDYTVDNLIENCILGIITSFDSFILHPCFKDEVADETMEMVKFFSALKHDPDKEDIKAFSDKIWDNSYFRYIYDVTADKERYIPRKTEFLKYADLDYYEESDAEKKLRRFFKDNSFDVFEAHAQELAAQIAAQEDGADEYMPSADEELDIFMDDIHDIISDNGKLEETDPGDIVREAFDLMTDYGINFRNDEQVSMVASLLMNAANNCRLWTDNGHTPNETAAAMQAQAGPIKPGSLPTIVPGSTEAANLLKEGLPEINNMGFSVDFDSNAVELPVYEFPDGKNGQMKASKKKVYPNDPCPCGSGKKYKKCCGR